MHRGLVLALGLSACGAETFAFDLVIEAPECDEAAFAQVSYIEIAVYGEHDGERCVLDQRCLWKVDELGALQSVDDFVLAMHAANPPLVSGLLEGAQHVEVNGRDTDCYINDPPTPGHPMCGGNDFAEVEDGAVPVVLTCEADACLRKEVPLCP